MPVLFPPARRPAASSARRWRSRSRARCAPEGGLPRARALHEAMEKLATADDVAAAVRAAGRIAQHA